MSHIRRVSRDAIIGASRPTHPAIGGGVRNGADDLVLRERTDSLTAASVVGEARFA